MALLNGAFFCGVFRDDELAARLSANPCACGRFDYRGPRHKHPQPRHDCRPRLLRPAGRLSGGAPLSALATAGAHGRVERPPPPVGAAPLAVDCAGRPHGLLWQLPDGPCRLPAGRQHRTGADCLPGRIHCMGHGRQHCLGQLSLACLRTERGRTHLAQPRRQRHVDDHDPLHNRWSRLASRLHCATSAPKRSTLPSASSG